MAARGRLPGRRLRARGARLSRCAAIALWLVGLSLSVAPPLVAAEELLRSSPFRLRSAASGAMMISTDQLGWLSYDRIGLLWDLQLGYSILPWLDVSVGSAFGIFLSQAAAGGLAAPLVGLIARAPNAALTPYVWADAGGAFTGSLFLPLLRAGIGVELPVSRSVSLGPALGFGGVLYGNAPGNSSDAVYVSIGLVASYASMTQRPRAHNAPARGTAPAPPTAASEAQPEPAVASGPEPSAAPVPPPVLVLREPSPTLMNLVDRAVPGRTDRTELLAPVLFGFDSDLLDPAAVALLHEVARQLKLQGEFALVEIRAYADTRGTDAYNEQLATRRGERVLAWLVEHGIARERLRVAALGAREPVESGVDDQAHEQNRRVVFRVLREAAEP